VTSRALSRDSRDGGGVADSSSRFSSSHFSRISSAAVLDLDSWCESASDTVAAVLFDWWSGEELLSPVRKRRMREVISSKPA
jgi:hypothetical protein